MKNAVRPKVKLRLGPLDYMLEGLSWVLLLGQWAYVLAVFHSLPAEIPMHFNATGNPDGYGSKAQLWVLLLVCTVLSIGLGVLNRYPHAFNYPVQITPANAAFQYKMAVQLMRQTKLAVVVVFGFILVESVQTSQHQGGILGKWMLPMLLLAFFLPVMIYFVRALFPAKGADKNPAANNGAEK